MRAGEPQPNHADHDENKAAHAEELNLSEEDAMSYVTMAFNLARHIKSN